MTTSKVQFYNGIYIQKTKINIQYNRRKHAYMLIDGGQQITFYDFVIIKYFLELNN